MNLVILGAGAVGAYYGGVLSRAGHEVTCFARGDIPLPEDAVARVQSLIAVPIHDTATVALARRPSIAD